MKNRTFIVALFTLCYMFCSLALQAQKQTLIGMNMNTNLYPAQIDLNRLSVGITAETWFRKHSGVETGLFYRTDHITNFVSYSDVSGGHTYSYTIAQRYISMPLLYKYYSRSIHVAAGPALDFFTGWKQKQDGSPFAVSSYATNPKVKLGFLLKVSKFIPVNKKFGLEPEIRFGSVRSFNNANLGIGLSGKYEL